MSTAQPRTASGAWWIGKLAAYDLVAAKEPVLAMGANLSDTGRKIGRACVEAAEKATLAAVKAHEEIGAASPVDIVKSTAATHAELARKLTDAGVSTLRQIIP